MANSMNQVKRTTPSGGRRQRRRRYQPSKNGSILSFSLALLVAALLTSLAYPARLTSGESSSMNSFAVASAAEELRVIPNSNSHLRGRHPRRLQDDAPDGIVDEPTGPNDAAGNEEHTEEDFAEELMEGEVEIIEEEIMDVTSGDLPEDMKEDLQALQEDLVKSSFPPGCSWECYLANYKHLNGTLDHTEDAALKHWLNHGKDKGKDCSCKEEVIVQEIEHVEEEIEELSSQDGDAAEEEKEGLEALAETLVELAFPPECSWECYLNNHKHLNNTLEHTEEAALQHWLNQGKDQGKDCTCKGDTAIEKEIEHVEEEIEDLEDQDDAIAQEEKEGLETLAENMIVTTFPPGCTWECYLDNYQHLNKVLEHTEEAALKHWVGQGQAHGKDCSCKDDVVIEEEIDHIEEEIQELDSQGGSEDEKEDLEALAETLIDNTFPPGCSWVCYLNNYQHLNETLEHTEEAALHHWLEHGRDKGKDCSCRENGVVDEVIGHVKQEIDALDDKDDDSVEQAEKDMETLAEDLLETTFPPGCSWECYLDNYKALKKSLEYTEEVALKHYLDHGRHEGLDCHCADDTVIVEEVENVEKDIENLDEEDTAAAEEQKEDLEALAETLIETTFPPGCTWECYVDNFNRQPGRKHNITRTENAALRHWVKQGKGSGVDCHCKDDELITDEVNVEVEHIELEIDNLDSEGDEAAEEEKEDLETLAETLVETTFPPGCSWECYLNNYNHLNITLEHTEEAALKHWLRHGKDNGRDCSCEGDESSAVVEESEPVEEEENETVEEGNDTVSQEEGDTEVEDVVNEPTEEASAENTSGDDNDDYEPKDDKDNPLENWLLGSHNEQEESKTSMHLAVWIGLGGAFVLIYLVIQRSRVDQSGGYSDVQFRSDTSHEIS